MARSAEHGGELTACERCHQAERQQVPRSAEHDDREDDRGADRGGEQRCASIALLRAVATDSDLSESALALAEVLERGDELLSAEMARASVWTNTRRRQLARAGSCSGAIRRRCE